MLQLCYELKLNPPTTVMIVDEAQDLSPLQYQIINNWKVGKTHIYLGGDDDQTIYQFMGASSELMLSYEHDQAKTTVLPKTHPAREIWNRNSLISATKFRNPNQEKPPTKSQPKRNQQPRHEAIKQNINPKVEFSSYAPTNSKLPRMGLSIEQISLHRPQKEEPGWTDTKIKIINEVTAAPPTINKQNLLLDLMTKAKLASYDKQLHEWKKGEFTYKFMQYYIGTTIDPAKIKTKIGTIHSVKGEEATIVILFNDITRKIADNLEDEKTLEDERKVWYVGMTRSKLILVIVDGYFLDRTKAGTFAEMIEVATQ
jgi:superfamily I DNA/RNA helicase